MKSNNLKNGSVLLEVIVGTAIISLLFVVLADVARYALLLSYKAHVQMRSTFLASEGIEAIKLMRDRGWAGNVAPLNAAGTDYYLAFESNQWTATTTPSVIDGIFTRSMRIQNVSRDAFDRIVSSGGALDPNTKKVSVTVSWKLRSIQESDIISTYITNVFNN